MISSLRTGQTLKHYAALGRLRALEGDETAAREASAGAGLSSESGEEVLLSSGVV